MLDNIKNFFKKFNKKEGKLINERVKNKDTAKERLHLVLMQDRANVSADFLDLMKQEIIDVIKKYIEVDESQIDVKLTNKQNSDGTTGAPALYANIPIKSIKSETRKITNAKSKAQNANSTTTVTTTKETKNTTNSSVSNNNNSNSAKVNQNTLRTNNTNKNNANNNQTKKGNPNARNSNSAYLKATVSQNKNNVNSKNENKKTENSNNKTKEGTNKK